MLSSVRSALAGSDNLRGILAMVAAMASFVAGDSIIKFVGRELPTGEIMFVRGVFASSITLCAAYATGALRNVYVAITPTMLIRAISDVGATLFFFLALQSIPFAEVNAIGQFAPLAITGGAALFLGEPVGWRRWTALVVGLIGVLIIIRPGTSAFHWASVFVLASVACVATRDLLTKHIGLAFPALMLTSFSAISVMLGGLALAPVEAWKMPSLGQIAFLATAGVTAFGGNYWTVIAMRSGDMGVVTPFRYVATVFAVLSGYFVFGELPDALTFLGIAIVIGAGLYTLHRERVRLRTQYRSVSVTTPE
ncbi:MAG: EamA family transporter [Proteobacteria bacterium]|jgi:Predicted permease, DMT superfamily|nr:MAG: EamA family transporter [Pseudomonadota bacterium]